MPRLAARLTYDEQDISSARKRYEYIVGVPIVAAKPSKTHRAMADIEDDIRYQKAFDDLYAASLTYGRDYDPRDTQLLALALTEQYMNLDVFTDRNGTTHYTPMEPQNIQALLEGVPPVNVISGFMALMAGTISLLASRDGFTPEAALEGVRGSILAASTH